MYYSDTPPPTRPPQYQQSSGNSRGGNISNPTHQASNRARGGRHNRGGGGGGVLHSNSNIRGWVGGGGGHLPYDDGGPLFDHLGGAGRRGGRRGGRGSNRRGGGEFNQHQQYYHQNNNNSNHYSHSGRRRGDGQYQHQQYEDDGQYQQFDSPGSSTHDSMVNSDGRLLFTPNHNPDLMSIDDGCLIPPSMGPPITTTKRRLSNDRTQQQGRPSTQQQQQQFYNTRNSNSHHRGKERRTAGHQQSTTNNMASVLCKYWSSSGQCGKYPNCSFNHTIRNIQSIPRAHTAGIYCLFSSTRILSSNPPDINNDAANIALSTNRSPKFKKGGGGGVVGSTSSSTAVGTPVVDVYSGGKDQSVKLWRLSPITPPPGGGSPSPLDLSMDLMEELSLVGSCTSLYYGEDCLFCGSSTGRIYVFHRQDYSSTLMTTLEGHTAEIQGLLLIDRILVSGDFNGRLQLWQPDPVNRTFVSKVCLELKSPITCFIEVSVEIPAAVQPNATPDGQHSPTTVRLLWVGCTGSIEIVDLVTLQLRRSIPMEPLPSMDSTQASNTTSTSNTNNKPSNRQPVMSLLRYDQHIVACLLGGQIKVFNLEGEEVLSNRVKTTLCSMTGTVAEDGVAVLVCGEPGGHVSAFSLPDLKEVVTFRSHLKDVRAVHSLGGAPSYFVTAGFEGDVSVWYWNKPSPNSNTAAATQN